MKKYDYYELLCNLTEREYSAYLTISENDISFATKLYKAIIDNVAGTANLFLVNEDNFIQWIVNRSPKDTEFSYLETIIIGFLSRNSNFMSKVYLSDETDYAHLSNTILSSWKNKTKTLKQNLNMFQMIYLRYIRFLNTEAGQNFLFCDSINLIPPSNKDDSVVDESVSYEDKPFYEQYEYKMKNLLLCKKEILMASSSTPIELCEMGAIWDATFNPKNGEKFTYLSAASIVRKTVSEEVVSRTSLYYHLKRLRVKLFDLLLNENILEKYFDVDTVYSFNGEIKTLKELLMDYLAEAHYDLEIAKKEKKLKSKQLPASYIADAVTRFCDERGYKYQNMTGKVLIKIKMDSTYKRKKGWKLYIFKSGAYIDFRNSVTGFITDLIPKRYFLA